MFERKQKSKKEVESVFSLINIIFLLIVFFLVAGHIASEQFKVMPPLLNEGERLPAKNCTMYVAKDGLHYDDALLQNESSVLTQLSQNCNGKMLLAAESDNKAILVVDALTRLKPYFSNIQLLVAKR